MKELEYEDGLFEEFSVKLVASQPVTADRYSGVRALWAKVIVRAIFDWVSYRDSPKLVQRKIADNAYRWLFEPSDFFNGFENICGILDLDPENIRDLSRRLTKDDVLKAEHLDRGPHGLKAADEEDGEI